MSLNRKESSSFKVTKTSHLSHLIKLNKESQNMIVSFKTMQVNYQLKEPICLNLDLTVNNSSHHSYLMLPRSNLMKMNPCSKGEKKPINSSNFFSNSNNSSKSKNKHFKFKHNNFSHLLL